MLINIYDMNQANFYISKGCVVKEFGYNSKRKESYVSFDKEDTRKYFGAWLTKCKEHYEKRNVQKSVRYF